MIPLLIQVKKILLNGEIFSKVITKTKSRFAKSILNFILLYSNIFEQEKRKARTHILADRTSWPHATPLLRSLTMVASDERFTQDFAGHNSPISSDRAQRRQAIMQEAENLAIVLHAEDRLTKALNLVLANAVTINSDGKAEVRNGQRTYTVSPNQGCTCEDAKRRTRFCKHYIAVLIAKRAADLLQGTQHAGGQELPQESTATSATMSSDRQIHEAPVAWTLSFACKGVDVHLTLRDVSDDALFARVKRILPKIQEKAQTSPGSR
jgi:hypothetical protein